MITTNNSIALAAAYNNEQGILCKGNNVGSMDVIGWPDSLPALTQQLVNDAEAIFLEPKSCTPLEFFERFTKSERAAIRVLAKSNDDIDDWMDMLKVAGVVDINDANTISGVDALVAAGSITEQRKAEILI